MFSQNRRDRKRIRRPSARRHLSMESLERRRLLAVATDLANITGRVFDDFSGDGFTAGEEVSGAILNLFLDDGDGQFEPGNGDTVIRMTTTDPSGNYTFERLPAGQYFVEQPSQNIDGRTLQQSVSPLITITAEQIAGQLIRTIDGFDQTFQSVIDNTSDGVPVTSTAAAPEAIGGSRDLLVDRTSDIGSVQLVVNDPVSPNLLQIASEAFGSGRRVVIWDGAGDDPAVVDDTGLGTIDLTSDGEAAGLRLVIGADLPAGSAVVRLYSSDGAATSNRFSSATLEIPQLTTQPTSVEFLPFDQFTTPTGSIGAADLTSIGAIELEIIAGPNFDALADLIGTIGPNLIPVPDFANFESIDLNLSKTLTTVNPNVNQSVTFNLSLTNEGIDTATGIVVTDTLPDGITFQSSQPSVGTFNPANGQWTIDSLAAGATATLTLTGLLTTSTPQTNTAEVTAADQFDADSTPGNAATTIEDDEASATVTPQVIDLTLAKGVSNALPNVGDSITFTLTLNNTGADSATNVVVADTLPSGLVLTDSSPSIGTFNNATSQWTIPALASGTSGTLTLTTTVVSDGSFTNIAEVVAADQFDPDSTPNNIEQDLDEDDEAEVSLQTQAADLSLTKDLIGTGATVGDNVTFVITLDNAGPNPATNVQIRDVLPSGLSFVSETTTLGDYNQNTGIWTIPNVPVTTTGTAAATLTLTANLLNASSQTNTAEIIASDQFDPDSTPGNALGNEDDIDSAVVTAVVVDLNLTKDASLSRPRPGETFTYTLTVNNTSTNDATGVLVTDLLPNEIIFQSATAGESFNPATGIWTVGTVAANSSRTLDIQAILDPNRTSPLDSITNTAEITDADQADTDSTPDNADANEDDQDTFVLTPARADLRLSKTAPAEPANVGEEITFTISTTNDGPDPSGSLTILDSIPANASFVRSTVSIGDYDPGTGFWTIPNLTINQTATLSIVLLANTAGSIDNVAQIIEATLPDPDSTPGNSIAGEDDQDDASVQSQAIDLSLEKDVDNATPRVGETFSYTVSVTNSGPDTATNIVVAEEIPEAITLIDSFPQTGTFVTSTRLWTIPSLAVGATTTLRLDARINSIAGFTEGDPVNTGLVNTAEIISVDQVDTDSTPNNADPEEDDQDSATVSVAIADLSLTKTTLTPAPNAGEVARFEIIVTNAGPDIATGLVVRDVLPNGLTFLSDTTSDALSDYNPLTGLLSISSLGVGQSTSLIINADVTESGTFTNTAELIEADQDDPDSTPNNNLAAEDDQASDSLSTPIIDLRLAKTSSPARPSVGSEVTFTLTTTNDGPDTATGVVVRDLLPTGFNFNSATPSSAYTPSTGLWNVGSLLNGESQELQIIGILSAIEPFTNQAEVIAADQADSDSTPDNGFANGEDDTATVEVNPASADLSLTKTIDDSAPNVGDDVTFTLTVRNDGPDVAESIEVLDSLPVGLTNLRSQTTTGVFNNSDLTFRVDSLGVGASATLTLIATLDFDSNNTTIAVTRVNSAEIINSSQRDPDSIPGNGSDDEDDDAAVEFIPQLIDLALTKEIDNNRPNLGETIEYLITARNDGPTDATNVVIEDQLPSSLTFVSSSPEVGSFNQQTGLWTIPQIAAGQSVELILRATVSPLPANVDAILSTGITNTAEVIQADQPDRDSTPGDGIGDDFAMVSLTLPQADLSLTKTVDEPNPDQNEFIQFLVIVQNDGPDTATNVVIQESLPAGLSDVTITPLRGEYNNATNLWTLDQLAPGQTAALQINARVTSPEIVTNVAEIIESDQIDPDSVVGNDLLDEDDQDQAVVTPQVVDVSVSAETIPDTAIEGETFELVVTVQNGQATISSASIQLTPLALTDRVISDASDVVVGIQIPEGLQLLNFDPNSAIFDEASGRWEVGNLAVGESRQLTLEFLVEAQSLKTFEVEVLETNEFDVDSTAGNNIASEDDQTTTTIQPPRTLTKRLFLSR